jgi:hypothetical protein
MVGILSVLLRFAFSFHSQCGSMREFLLGMSAGAHRPSHSLSLSDQSVRLASRRITGFWEKGVKRSETVSCPECRLHGHVKGALYWGIKAP